MKEINKKITSLVLAGLITTSVAEMPVKAYSERNNSNNSTIEYYYKNPLRVKGMYPFVVDGKLVYIFLDNYSYNEFLPYYDALYLAQKDYNNVYLYSKTVYTKDSVNGYSVRNGNNVTMYALSYNSYEKGWTKVNNMNSIDRNTYVATSIALGDFLLEKSELKDNLYNQIGFANIDINNDGKEIEKVYLGNDKINKLYCKEDALKWGFDKYGKYFVYKKVLSNTDLKAARVLYAISDKESVKGWERANINNIKTTDIIATDTEYYETLLRVYNNIGRNMYLDETYIEVYINPTPTPMPNPNDYKHNSMLKEDALKYGYDNYSNFCIMKKEIVDPRTKDVIILYALSFSTRVDGWEIVTNNEVPYYETIFLTMNDAYNYEYLITNNYIRVLK